MIGGEVKKSMKMSLHPANKVPGR
ncbi:hypothetical protein Goarm_003555 [Gossypium armourianum]|uniref:Uncharacterized protein n=1 Tax=Gossypium armourianum TaxID=34283 RepID=A0A7J9K3J7_9ROSI|nr:hypothetical protein [Gossypium armourianum]